MVVGDQTRFLRTCHQSESYLDASGGHIMPTAYTPYHHRASTSMNSPLLISRVHGFMRLSPYPYTSINSIELERRLVRPGNVFLVINSPMSVLTVPDEV
ncbi:uncharacterized protein TNCV_3058911 [Trichonephila clavipes]|nr:uncharacterized protein TNCV_3058911 [Trichonephila clavipes]